MTAIMVLHKDSFAAQAAGNKAAYLLKLIENGYTVPEAFVLQASFFLQEAWLTEAVEVARQLNAKLSSPTGWIVRSSSLIEDGLESSNAGRFESIVIQRADELASALERVIHSGGMGEGQCGVLVQAFKEADWSGIVFSLDPLTGVQQPVIELTGGRGDQVAGGTVNPLTYQDGHWVGDGCDSLSNDLTSEIVQAAIRMRQVIGREVDMEFCSCDGSLYWLQVRPVTAILEQMPGEWFLLDQCTEPASPLDQTLDPSGLFHLDMWDVRFVHGYPYIQMKPVQVGVSETKPVDIWEEWLDMRNKFEPVFDQNLREDLTRHSADTLWQVILDSVIQFRSCFEQYLQRDWLRERRSLSLKLKTHLQNALGDQVHFEVQLGILSSGLDTLTARKTHLLNQLISTAQITLDFETISTDLTRFPDHPWVLQFKRFIEEFGYESPQPVLTYLPTLAEECIPLMSLINSAAKQTLRIEPNLSTGLRMALIEKICSALPVTDREDFLDCLQRFRLAVTRTENDDYLLQKGGASVRRAILELGERLRERGIIEQKEQVYYLTMAELEGGLGGIQYSFREVICERMQIIQTAKHYKPTQWIRNGIAVRGRLRDGKDHSNSNRELIGQTASGGAAQGPVFVVNNPLDRSIYEQIPPNSIIVAPILSPSLVYNLHSAAAIVTEVGGFLSHGAIFARERGIPALVAVQSAISLLHTGDQVIVDADLGRISFVD
ncbi:MAG: hypothetical protein K0R67_2533 [Paenibacillus sp.]|nr:hypothetical protein [Paenibacillus sp.]